MESKDNTNKYTKKPKYIFLNTLVHEKDELIDKLKQDSFVKRSRKSGKNNNDDETESNNKNSLQTLNRNEYQKDDIIKNLLIFSHDSLLNKKHELFTNGHLVQIDKSSCLVPFILNPPKDSHVIDAAAAPVIIVY
jgi:16S rRNA C967 or C1407 C5-methylase (RsmB/RsmF family)